MGGPVVALSLWGGAYLFRCYKVLCAPGVPVVIDYTAPGGKLQFRASSYRVAPLRGYVLLEQPQILDAAGKPLAQAQSVRVTDLKPFYGADQVIRVHAFDVSGRVVRLTNGQFELARYLPESKGPPTRIPYTVQVDTAQFTLEDQTQGGTWRQPLVLHNVKVDGIGDDWMARADGNLYEKGSLTGWLQHTTGGRLIAKVSTPGIQAAEAIRHFVPASTLTVAEAEAKGSGTLSYANGEGFHVTGNVIVKASGVRAGTYSVDEATFQGVATETSVVGKAEAWLRGVHGEYNGLVDWSRTLRLAGTLDAQAPSGTSLPGWVQKQIPRGVGFADGAFRGYVALNDGKPLLSGDLQAAEAHYEKQTFARPTAHVALAKDQLRVVAQSQLFDGALTYSVHDRRMDGYVKASRIEMQSFASRFGASGLRGTGQLMARFEGSASQPRVRWMAMGEGQYRQYPFGCFEATGQLQGRKVQLSTGIIDGPMGVAVLQGDASLDQPLNLSVKLRGLQASFLHPNAKGTANFEGRVSGNLQEPKLQGWLEAYGIGYKDERIPAASAKVLADRRGVTVQGLNAVRGTAKVAGDAHYRFADGDLNANLSAERVQLAELLGEDYVGLVDLPNLNVRGVRNRFSGAGSLHAKTLVAKGVKVNDLGATFEANNRVIILRSSAAKVAGGSVQANGRFNFASQTGYGHLIAQNLDIENLTTPFTTSVSLAGSTSGEAWVTLHEGRYSGQSKGRVENVTLNGTPLGSGPFDVSSDAERTEADFSVGLLTRSIEAEHLVVLPQKKEASGNLYVRNLRLEDLSEVGLGFAHGLSNEALARIESLKGTVNSGLRISGRWDDPNVAADSLDVHGLELSGVPLGNLSAVASRIDKHWEATKVSLSLPSKHVLTASGKADEDGTISADVAGRNLDLSTWSTLLGASQSVRGVLNFDGTVTGDLKSPVLQASADASGLFADPKDPHDKGLTFQAYALKASEASGITLSGLYAYQGFGGTVEGSSSLRYPFNIDDRPATATITLDPRRLNTIEGLSDTLDPTRTDGTLTGKVDLEYFQGVTKGVGQLKLLAKQIGFIAPTPNAVDVKRIDTSLRDVDVTVDLGHDVLNVKGEATSSFGGKVTLNLSDPVIGKAAREGGLQGVLDSSVTGLVELNNFTVRQTLQGRKEATGTAKGKVDISGPLRRPLIDGGLTFANVDATMPTLTTQESTSTPPVINPEFRVRMGLYNAARVATSTADLYLIGDGTLSGSLAAPVASANLMVDKGTIRLPGGLVRITPGGTLDFSMQSIQGVPYTTLAMDVQGKTSITAQRYNDTVQRYQITLDIKGDLLKDGGLNMTAESDPPDLSQDKILASLGRTSLLSTVSSGNNQTDTQKQLREAFVGFALPTLLDPMTGNIAKSLGLEYLSLEYNPFDQATVTVGKTLGTEFSLQARRQIGEPLPGFRPLYEVRLTYSPRWGPKAFRRFSFSLGADQDRPWKAALEYGYRFGGARPTDPEKPATVISSPERP